MPLTKSAKKALLVGRRRKAENDLVRAKIKNAVKGAKISIKNQAEDIQEKLTLAYRELDIAAKKNVIHDHKAARIKSRLAKASGKAAALPVKAVKKSKKTVSKKKK